MLGAVVVASQASADLGSGGGTVTPGMSYASTDQVIVKMQRGRQPELPVFSRAAERSVTSVRSLGDGVVVLKLPSAQQGAALRATVAAFANAPHVEWAEPDVRMRTMIDDPRRGEQWDLTAPETGPIGIDVEGAWDLLPADLAQITVAVVDTGYVDHQDLSGAIVAGYDFVGDERLANDGDGRDGDARDPGDWITSQESRRGFFRGCPAMGSSWHGTHVGGTIAAVADNGIGITGINPNAKILPVRVLGKCGGYTSDITDGVRWAAGITVADTPQNPSPASVINLSLGGGGSCSQTWQSAIDAVTAKGATVVVSAGNSDTDAAGFSPASCSKVLTVAATGKTGNRAYYSNYGSTVEIAAPGGDRLADDGDTILSTLNTGNTSPVTSPGGDTYVKYQGTSMAAPHVAGVVSLLLAVDPSLSPGQIATVLSQSATSFPTGSSCGSQCGAGIVNARNAVAQVTDSPPPTTQPPPTTETPPTTQPPVPGSFDKLTPEDGESRLKKNVTVSWQPSAGATEYWVCIELDAQPDGACDSFNSGPYTSTQIRFIGLSSRSTYEWQVQARNANGTKIADSDAWTFNTR
jgi:serine protease